MGQIYLLIYYLLSCVIFSAFQSFIDNLGKIMRDGGGKKSVYCHVPQKDVLFNDGLHIGLQYYIILQYKWS